MSSSTTRYALFAVLIFGAILGVITVRRASAADAAIPQAGQQAPQFTLPSQDGSNISLSSFRGKWIVLYFYPKDMTSGCTLEAHNFQRDIGKYEKLDSVIVGVSVDSADSHKQFCAKQGLTFKLLSDQDKKVVADYGSLGNYMGMKIAKRNTFLIDPQGKIVKVWTGVDPANHSEEVLSTLEQMEKKSA
jgi:thioredoxin-dependent peroxiredoxin